MIGRNNDLISQILGVFEGKKKNKKKKEYSVRQIADEHECMRKGGKLTSGTTKLMAISSQIKDLGVGEERPLLKFLESSGNAAAVKVDFGAIE